MHVLHINFAVPFAFLLTSKFAHMIISSVQNQGLKMTVNMISISVPTTLQIQIGNEARRVIQRATVALRVLALPPAMHVCRSCWQRTTCCK